MFTGRVSALLNIFYDKFLLLKVLHHVNKIEFNIQCFFMLYKICEIKLKLIKGCSIEKGVCQGCILSPCLFNLYAEYIIWHAGLDEAQAGIKIAGRNINNLRYADDTTLKAEHKEKLKSLLMKGEWKSWLKIQHSKNLKLRLWHPFPSLHGK